MPSTCVELLREIEIKNRSYRREKRQERNDAWHHYLTDCGDGKSLLQLEMEYIRACHPGDLPEETERQGTTLVILVGETFEPLLQSIYAHRPSRLVPIVNTWYGNKENKNSAADHWRSFYQLIQDLPASITRRIANLSQIKAVDPVADDPSEVFTYLQTKLAEDLRNPTKRVIVDITGAKKTMVAGAFTLAAYTKAEIFYIDPEKEDEDRKPCGFSARFRRLEGPLEQLALHTWQQVEELYSRSDFNGALQLLKAISDVSETEKLKLYLEVCRDWESGQLRDAHRVSEQLTREMPEAAGLIPPAVNKLWEYWPDPNHNGTGLNLDFFCNPTAIVLYIEDELQRAKRLQTNGRYRSAFSRAYALHETLLKARLALLHHQGQFIAEKVISQNHHETVDLKNPHNAALNQAILGWLLGLFTGEACEFLRRPEENRPIKNGKFRWKGQGEQLEHRYRIWWEKQDSPDYLSDHLDLYSPQNETLKNVRNLVTHSYFPVQPDHAESAVYLAQMSLADYGESWIKQMNWQDQGQKVRFEAPIWNELKETFDLSFLPEQNQPPQAKGG